MQKKRVWGWRCLGGLAALLLLSHCGGTRTAACGSRMARSISALSTPRPMGSPFGPGVWAAMKRVMSAAEV